ncbi:MAG: hypothetical protein R3F65_14770 [bacterium]
MDESAKPIWKQERLLRITWPRLGEIMERLATFVARLHPRPEVVVGIVRGGLSVALHASHAIGRGSATCSTSPATRRLRGATASGARPR